MKYILTDKTYIMEEIFGTLEEAQEELKRWEAFDKLDGLYIKDNYMIFPKGMVDTKQDSKGKGDDSK